MKRDTLITSLIPSAATLLSLLVLPIALSIYFAATRYADTFVGTHGVDYELVQRNWLAGLFLTDSLAHSLTRFMDFVFWGVIASIVILAGWAVSVVRTTLKNHTTEESFINFRASAQSWHGHFVVAAVIKVLLVLLMLYLIVAGLVFAVPGLATAVSQLVEQANAASVFALGQAAGLMVALQLLFILALKLFKITRAE